MQLNINAIQTTTNVPDCMTIQELQKATSQDEHLQHLKNISPEVARVQRSYTTRHVNILDGL